MRAAAGRPRPAGGFELWAWFFMRASGLALVLLALGHLAVMHLIHSVDDVDFQFVAQRYATPFWRSYDLLLLLLALLHGCNGLRTVIEDYCQRPILRKICLGSLLVACVFFSIIGSWVIFTFSPGVFTR